MKTLLAVLADAWIRGICSKAIAQAQTQDLPASPQAPDG
jgi:hypothetical protein